jgi:hypothetical protein
VKRRCDKGIPLGDYIKFHAPEPLVRNQLDRDELRYTWKDSNGNKRASDDGSPLPPKRLVDAADFYRDRLRAAFGAGECSDCSVLPANVLRPRLPRGRAGGRAPSATPRVAEPA